MGQSSVLVASPQQRPKPTVAEYGRQEAGMRLHRLNAGSTSLTSISTVVNLGKPPQSSMK